jgi:hypothetical protein
LEREDLIIALFFPVVSRELTRMAAVSSALVASASSAVPVFKCLLEP